MRKFVVSAVALLLFFGLTAESCETETKSTADSGSEEVSDESAKPAEPAGIGDSITLKDLDENEYKITVTKLVDPVTGGEFDEPQSGNRFIGVKLTIKSLSDGTYNDSPSNGAIVIDTRDEQWDPTILTEGNCKLPTNVKIAPGAQRKICIPFEIGDRRKPKTFQFALDSGFGDENGEWSLR